jgi:SAM-dependent methyltransferase
MAGVRTREDMLLAIRAFQESRVFLTALELDVFRAAGEGASVTEIAARIGASERGTGMLLNALVALDALEKAGGVFRCTPESKGFCEAPAEFLHSARKWDTWSTLTDCVRTGTTARRPDRERKGDGTEVFIGAMRSRALPLATRLVETVGTEGVGRLLDLGGGPGTFALAFAQAAPGLRAEILDLPEVVPIAERHIRAAGLRDRVSARVGDLRTDSFGQDYDLILASAICHMLDEAENQDLFRRCARALAPGGRLVIRDFVLEPDRTQPTEAALFALNMLTATPHGNVYTEAEYRNWLQFAGFSCITRHRNGEDVLVATR